nr:hypothetical protein [uncultured Albidiferax sp.]
MKDARDWVQLIFVVLGGVLALVAFFQNLRQRRVENALKFISLFRDGLQPDDLKHWHELFVSSSELAGAKHGQYKKEWEQFAPIAEYFKEGAPDGHAIARMATALDVVCHQVVSKVADPLTVYYELGQLLESMHDWLCAIPGVEGKKTLLESSYPSIARFFANYKPRPNGWPSRVYAFIE